MSEEFNDRMFRLINNLPPTEPEREDPLSKAPEESPMAKWREKLELEMYLGRPLRDEQQANFSLDELAKKFAGEPAIMPQFTSTDFAKRFEGSELNKRAQPKDSSGAIRYEEKIIGDNRWREGFNSANELVSAYLLSSGE